jgi:hypothetical protein
VTITIYKTCSKAYISYISFTATSSLLFIILILPIKSLMLATLNNARVK